ncbi:unnamed protein product [Nippostrongylus brasiliensis]|uniref:Enoyl-CoA hydratase/isomerase family protein n=1 Tax=Nippostrongylus brasiliensis TaxID=27835 RepID=A0A0N4YW16_NIPBR|nr:unnamed protein product [Nippostrongylus brasiliensis]
MPLVNTRLDGEILLIGINRPEKRNCVNHATAIALVKAFERFNRDPANAVTDDRFPNEYRYLGPSIIPLEKPLIVAVEGYAVAGGLELSLMADIRVCSRSAKFGVFCRRHGVPLIDGGTVRLPRIIGLGR